MAKITKEEIIVPASVPAESREEYINNYMEITKGTGRLMLFAGDQKVEHLNDDFYGEGIAEDDADPEHLFRIANAANIGVFAAQYGLIARYGPTYSEVPYLVKLNSKTNLVKTDQRDPVSRQWVSVEDVIQLKKNSNLKILGVGYTVYIGSEFEAEMLTEAAQIVKEAHKHGLITVFWMYPRGKAVKDEKDPHLIAGAAGVAASLGADFAKVNYPKPKDESISRAEAFREAILAAGRTKIVCAGGSSTDVKKFLQTLQDQIFISGASGNATGRNIHQKGFEEAVRMCNAISAITLNDATAEEALRIYEGS
ncbi:aldolase [Candidatus Woesearchaeota archaeon]|nr:MAG: aldolase [Candidatus Woesearchaeota archaeon]